MRAREFLLNGGWANVKTQDTIITPIVVEKVLSVLKNNFEPQLNSYLKSKQLPPIQIGNPCGSGTYYKRDLQNNPTKQYGDIDVHFYIPRMPELNNNQTVQLFANNVKEFCDQSAEFETENGKNVICKLGNDYVQVDLVNIYYENAKWASALAPEHNVKGVLSASLYSSLAEALKLSIGDMGVQAKTVDGKLVKFNNTKGTKLHTISTNKETWAVDIANFFGAKKLSGWLEKYPGAAEEIRIVDIIGSIKGIATTLEENQKLPQPYANAVELLATIKEIYLNKINKVITSNKFDKAATPAAVEKAEQTKRMLAAKSAEIAGTII